MSEKETATDIVEEKETKDTKQEQLEYVLEKTGLDLETINNWKRQHGSRNIHVLVLNEHEIYIFKSILRLEHKQLISQISGLEKEPEERKEELYGEQLVSLCLLHPKVSTEFTSLSPAGLIPTLKDAIEIKSMFLPPALVIDSVVTL